MLNKLQKCQHDEGFTLIELMIALGISLLTLSIASGIIHLLIVAVVHPITIMNDELALNRLEAKIRSDVQTAIIVPPTQEQHGSAQELQLAGMDLEQNWHSWTYRAQQGLTRTTDASVVMLDPSVTNLQLRFIPTDQLGLSGETSAPLFTNIVPPRRQSITLSGQVYTNGIAEVILTRGHAQRRLHVASDIVPTGFTIEHGPQWHAVLSRSSTTHRSFLGLAQKTTYEVDGSVTYSLDQWHTSHLWCKYAIYAGRANGDPVVEQHTANGDPNETARAIFHGCQQIKHARGLTSTPADSPLQMGLTRP